MRKYRVEVGEGSVKYWDLDVLDRNQCWTDTVDLDVLDALNTSEILQLQIPKMGMESKLFQQLV